MTTREEQAWKKCQADFQRNKAESKTWQEHYRMNQKSYAEYESAISCELQNTAP